MAGAVENAPTANMTILNMRLAIADLREKGKFTDAGIARLYKFFHLAKDCSEDDFLIALWGSQPQIDMKPNPETKITNTYETHDEPAVKLASDKPKTANPLMAGVENDSKFKPLDAKPSLDDASPQEVNEDKTRNPIRKPTKRIQVRHKVDDDAKVFAIKRQEDVAARKKHEFNTLSSAPTITRACKSCGEELPLDEFPVNHTCADGHIPHCKKCHEDIRKGYINKAANKLLLQLVKLEDFPSSEPGNDDDPWTVTRIDGVISYRRGEANCRVLLVDLVNSGYLDRKRLNQRKSHTYWLTPAGIREAARLEALKC